jgi:RimJ/RimL family protein N-acetyltransferase
MNDDDPYRILSLRGHPDFLDEAAEYFSTKWGIPRITYEDSLQHSFSTASPLPRWYLLRKGDRTVGCFGLIANDFISRQDLWPWLCALYVDPEDRGQGLGARLLAFGRSEAARLGFQMLYLGTDLTDYYEKLDWRPIGTGYGPSGEPSRIYEIEAGGPSEDAAATAPAKSIPDCSSPTLTTNRLTLRPYSLDDFEAVHRYAGNLDNLLRTTWGPNTEEETRAFLRHAVGTESIFPRRDYHFGIVERASGQLIGGCGLHVDDVCEQAEIGWVLHVDFQRQGFGTEAAAALLRFGFKDLGLHRIYAVCRADNLGSYRVMERNSMRREAHLLQKRPGRPCDPLPWYDEYQYAMLREEWTP